MEQETFSGLAGGQDYSALRQMGTSAERARMELAIPLARARALEAMFRCRIRRDVGDLQLPRFARHDAHVAAVMDEGGFCALSDHRVGKNAVAACLPLVWP